MRVGISLKTLPVDGEKRGSVVARIVDVATTAERLGYDAVHTLDHPVPHPQYDLPEIGHHYHNLDPFVELAVAAAATSRIRLWTNLVVLALRNPFLMCVLRTGAVPSPRRSQRRSSYRTHSRSWPPSPPGRCSSPISRRSTPARDTARRTSSSASLAPRWHSSWPWSCEPGAPPRKAGPWSWTDKRPPSAW